MPVWGRSGAEWRRVRAMVLKGRTQCEMPDCKYPGVPLDFESDRRHPLHPTVDHILQVKDTEGWDDEDRRRVLHDPNNLRPAHNACNATRNGHQRPGKRLVRRQPERSSRSWGV